MDVSILKIGTHKDTLVQTTAIQAAISAWLAEDRFTDKWTLLGPDLSSRFAIKFKGTGPFSQELARAALRSLRDDSGGFISLYCDAPSASSDALQWRC